jgi:outer membrane protein OmpA-like peptidoglycan-associated protein
VYNLAFGTDTTFGPGVGNKVGTSFLGLKVVYEFPNQTIPIRLWTQVSTDVSVSERNIILGIAGIQIGIPIHSSFQGSDSQARTTATSSAPPQTKDRNLVVSLDPQKVFFSTNSASLRPDVKAILKTVGEYLDSDEKHWELLEIIGHADQRGKFNYNLKLSQQRAKSVKKALIEGGANSRKMTTDALSYLKPIDIRNNRNAWAQNRRVELTFHKVDHPEMLLNKLKPLMTQKPLNSSKGDS